MLVARDGGIRPASNGWGDSLSASVRIGSREDGLASRSRPRSEGPEQWNPEFAIDAVARTLATSRSRRRAIGLISGTLLAGSVLRPRSARAAGIDCPQSGDPTATLKCESGGAVVSRIPQQATYRAAKLAPKSYQRPLLVPAN